jgi:anthranilate phosphoribosyltransferase
MIREVTRELRSGANVPTAAIESAFGELLRDDVDRDEIARFLLGLRAVELDGELLAGFARALRGAARPVACTVRPLIDTCGTGGDGSGSFNISTAAAIVVVAAGGAVAKHGNRSVSSRCGSADVVEALGIPLDLPAGEIGRMIDATGFGFLYAPNFHSATRNVQAVRRELGVPTVFNQLGPLVNPIGAEYQVVGVADPALALPMAEALRSLGCRGALVVHGDGLDEIGLHVPASGYLVRGGELEPIRIDAEELGIARAPIAALAGGGAKRNAEIVRKVLGGAPGPHHDVVALNAGAALFTAELVPTIADGYARASELLRDGSAARALARACETASRLTLVEAL